MQVLAICHAWLHHIEKQHEDSRIVKKLDVKISGVEHATNNIGRAVEPTHWLHTHYEVAISD